MQRTPVRQDHRYVAVRGDVTAPQLERTADPVQPLVFVEGDPFLDSRKPRGAASGEDRA